MIPRVYFEQGRYDEIIAVNRRRSPEDEVALIGAYAFLGHLEEATNLWELSQKRLSLAQKVRCRFYLGVACTRISLLQKAKVFFQANLDAEKSCRVERAAIYQGLGFYLYFIGRFKEARRWAHRAEKAAIESGDVYFNFLATDLLGHCVVQQGERAQGLRLMKRARQLARKHGNANFAAAFASAALIYEAEAGWRPLAIVKELEEAARSRKIKDSYTHANLILELARQLTLRGDFAKAQSLLNHEASSIYSFGNRRQELMLQIRLAEIAFSEGDVFALGHFLQAGRRCLHHIADRAHEARLIGLDMKAHELSRRTPPPELEKRLLKISENYGSHINKQILFRRGLAPDPQTSPLEDPLHNLFMTAQNDASVASRMALEFGYAGLWARFQKFKEGSSFFAVLEDGRSAVVGSPQKISHLPNLLTPQQLKLLQALGGGFKTKQALISSVWGYAYESERHDPLLHSAFTKLRKALSDLPEPLLAGSRGWSLNPAIAWRLPSDRLPEPVSAELGQDIVIGSAPGLNFRQLKALREWPSGGTWSIQTYKSVFDVSTMTAFRDLIGLLAEGRVLRTGRGRATRYHLNIASSAGVDI